MDSASEAGREDERRRVLEMLEQGRISAAEAAELIAALDAPSAAQASSPPPGPAAGRRPPVPRSWRVAAGLARALARATTRLAFVLAGFVGAVARLSRRARLQ